MNGEYLYEAMGDILAVYVDEAEKVRFSKPLWRSLIPVAACLAILIGISVGAYSVLYGIPLSDLAEAQSLVRLTPVPPAQKAVEHFRGAPLFNWGSLLLGLTAWILPLIGLIRKQHLALGSYIACTLSLLLQVCAVLHRIDQGDFAALSETMWFILLAAVVLVAGTVVVNILAHWVSKKQ